MTQEQLENARTYIPSLFAAGEPADLHTVDTQESGFTYFAGIPSMYSSRTGKKVCRGDINGIGRMASQAKWFNQLGGYYTFSQEVSDAIEGYPQDAILYYKDTDSGEIRLVRSLIPNNEYNFVEEPSYINNEYWSFVDNVTPTSFRPRVFPDFNNLENGSLAIGQEFTVPYNALFAIQMGSEIDTTSDNSDLYVYLAVKKRTGDVFYTAALLSFIPASAAVITQGILCQPDYIIPSKFLNEGLHAFNSPSPVQIYLNAGDTVKIVMNRDYTLTESYQYYYCPLTA